MKLSKLLRKVCKVNNQSLVSIVYTKTKKGKQLKITTINPMLTMLTTYGYYTKQDKYTRQTTYLSSKTVIGKEVSTKSKKVKKLIKLAQQYRKAHSKKIYSTVIPYIYQGYAVNLETGEILTPIHYNSYEHY